MSSKRVRIIILSGLILIAIVIGVSLVLTYGLQKSTVADLPDTEESPSPDPNAPGGGSITSNNGPSSITVGVDNVQVVIATLTRPESYERHLQVESYYAENGRADYDIRVTVVEADSAMTITGPGDRKHIVLAGGKLYIWYEGDKVFFSGPADGFGEERELSDGVQMILTYEDIIKLDTKSIQEAVYTAWESENCIKVVYTSGVLQYKTTCYISVATGLLTYAEQYDGQALVYRMTSSDFVQPVTDTSGFSLPDGNNALSGL